MMRLKVTRNVVATGVRRTLVGGVIMLKVDDNANEEHGHQIFIGAMGL